MYFENSISNKIHFHKINLIDVHFLTDFSMLKKIDKKLKYTIIFWNGEKQYREHFLKIKKLKNFRLETKLYF